MKTLGILVGIIFLLSMIQGATMANAQTDIKNQGTIVYETFGGPEAIDPATNYESFGSGLNEQAYETLVFYDGNDATTLVGQLATDYTISADGLKYTFTLREGVKYHDGKDFNAYTMKYSLDRAIIMADPSGPSWMIAQAIKGAGSLPSDINVTDAVTYLNAGGIKVLSDFSLEINLDFPYAPFIYALAYRVGAAISPYSVITNEPSGYSTDKTDDLWGMVPLTDWFPSLDGDYSKLGLASDHDAKDSGVVPSTSVGSDQEHTWLSDHEAGTGPYKLTEAKPDEYYKLEKNTAWWGTFVPNAPDTALVKIVPETETRILDLKAGDADIATISASSADQIINLDTKKSKVDGVTAYITPSFSVGFVGFTVNDTLPGDFLTESASSTYDASQWKKYDWSTTNDASQDNPFTALQFRKAWAELYDYTATIQQTFNGLARRLEGVIPDGMFGHVNTLISDGLIPNTNKDAAKALFQQIGWQGHITIMYNEGNDARKNIALSLKNSIESLGVGITMDVQAQPWATYLASMRTQQLPMFIVGWLPDYADPDNYIASFLHGEYGIYSTWMKYNNPALNTLIEQGANTTDASTRLTIYKNAEEMAAKDYPIIYAYQADTTWYTRSWLNNFNESGTLNPMASFPVFAKINKGTPAGTPGFEFIAGFLALGAIAVTVSFRRKK